MAEANMNIYQKLAKTRKEVEVMKRDARGINYTCTTERDSRPVGYGLTTTTPTSV